jgi:oligopeptide transport system substrate-binding protein
MKERGTRLSLLPEMGTVYTCLNTEDDVMKNVVLRRAMAMAIDHNWTVANLYSGSAMVAESLIPPSIGGHEAGYHPYRADDASAQIDRAKEYMTRAGYPGGVDPRTGKPLRIRFENSGTSTTSRHHANRVRDEMRRIGIEVDIIVNTWPQMIEKMRNKDFQMAGLAWGFDYPDGQNILQLLYGPNEAPGINSANYKNPEYDTLYEQISTMEDSPERSEIYKRMARMVADDVPWIIRVHRLRTNLQQSWVLGIKYTETHDQNWRFVDIDTEMRDTLVARWNKPVLWPVAVASLIFFGLIGVTVLSERRAA